ncbi:hypothetical protein M422DRAFT_263835 [Sphaerobolus stellatus SS14]|uniref:Uncharacterized protein n=1 Tax=Sphaerobolus stellatus (strain SS14) TaxID=990650 RepID=A0A0C9UGW1_SPHS4|nr:hypothetical protein M422DRAFT_263835 [Sphaerobolus stellatus SS14]
MSQQPSTQAGPLPDSTVDSTFTSRGVQHVQAMSLDVQIKAQQDKAFLNVFRVDLTSPHMASLPPLPWK